jgi:hypothetical protein
VLQCPFHPVAYHNRPLKTAMVRRNSLVTSLESLEHAFFTAGLP